MGSEVPKVLQWTESEHLKCRSPSQRYRKF